MSRSSFAQTLQRPGRATDGPAQHCRAGLPSQDNPTSRPCLRRAQCELHQRYRADLEKPEGLPPGAKVLIRPWVDGCQCHFFRLANGGER